MGEIAVLSVANFYELFVPDHKQLPDVSTPIVPHEATWKATIWPENDGFLFIGSHPVVSPVGSVPRTVLATGPANDFERSDKDGAITSRVLEFTSTADQVHILATVYSDVIRRLAERLRNHNSGVRITGLPSCLPGQIRYWNSKLGGRELLSTIEDIKPFLPPSRICYTVDEANHALQRASPTSHFVLKPNLGVGGAGLVSLKGGARYSDLSQRVSSAANTQKKKRTPLLYEEPFLLEAAVGNLRTNRSLTVDAEVAPDGTVVRIGRAWQILKDGFRYEGIYYSPGSLSSRIAEQVEQIMTSIGSSLFRRGFAGFVNADFVVTSENVVALAEINVRRSAPLDQFLVLRRKFGPAWSDSFHVRFLEHALAPAVDESDDWLAKHHLNFRGDEGVLPFAPIHPASKTWPLLFVATSASALEGLLGLYEQCIRAAN